MPHRRNSRYLHRKCKEKGAGLPPRQLCEEDPRSSDSAGGPETSSSDEKPKSRRRAAGSSRDPDPGKPAANIRFLLATGILEGIPVTYRFLKHEVELQGFIKDQGYACGCSKCNYSTVLSALEFERHAGAVSKHQNNHIFLQNGKSLHVVIKELVSVPLNELGLVVEGVIGCRPNFERYQAWLGLDPTLVPPDDLTSTSDSNSSNNDLVESSPSLTMEGSISSGQGPESAGGLVISDHLNQEFLACTIQDSHILDGSPSAVVNNCPEKIEKRTILSMQDVQRIPESNTMTGMGLLVLPEEAAGGCILCRMDHYSVGVFDSNTVMICNQCKREYHVGCLQARGICDLKRFPGIRWLCCSKCEAIHSTLQNMIFDGTDAVQKSILNCIRERIAKEHITGEPVNEISWRLLRDVKNCETQQLLSKATSIFQGSFDPLLGPSGYNLLPAIVYGRTGGDADGQDFSGMYCAVLIIRSVVVSAGLLRIFGQEVAELPLIATTKDGRGKGYCRCLFLLIESLLSFLGVDNLIIPATEEAAPMLTRKFGFTKTSLDKVWKYAQDFSPIVLAGGASMYEKSIARIKS